MTDDDNLDNMSWFYQLTMDERVHLLVHPHGSLPPGLAERLSDQPGVLGSEWGFADSEGDVFLAGPLADKLKAWCEQLTSWWDIVTLPEQAYLIEKRDRELAAEYADVVRSAGEPVPNGPFRLPPMVRVYVEMKARAVA
jgi:hypothetical protein